MEAINCNKVTLAPKRRLDNLDRELKPMDTFKMNCLVVGVDNNKATIRILDIFDLEENFSGSSSTCSQGCEFTITMK